ncbi:hypothetical protein BDK51DRAFT_46332 [Blyttiomyces helicus]|uniref:Uncharacterized protein n=1 Tax=Blyttiomyces helicus TaxID=388810 RepID=A0A4P9WDZ0_9FUNG|nr:hypothetical protein BDK51DRAFT_46332 [Blyttiomyces helicus]|eukprot:RKO90794.1 hypothetical protein BDK51DRAFT_46332 [Blyttiomyces helicus]
MPVVKRTPAHSLLQIVADSHMAEEVVLRDPRGGLAVARSLPIEEAERDWHLAAECKGKEKASTFVDTSEEPSLTGAVETESDMTWSLLHLPRPRLLPSLNHLTHAHLLHRADAHPLLRPLPALTPQNCTHRFCAACLTLHVSVTHGGRLPLPCPAATCKVGTVTLDVVRGAVDTAMYRSLMVRADVLWFVGGGEGYAMSQQIVLRDYCDRAP